ncbi:MAG: superinfection immunity protein [Alphaproteobacteria bacterium]|nr:superinfection immunity protein [Alphaproteobacteria bacterium]
MPHFLEAYLESLLTLLVLSPVVVAIICLYLAPYLIARKRKHPNHAPILVINLGLGWSVVGWILCLAWAVCDLQRFCQPFGKFSKRTWAVRYLLFSIVVAIPVALLKA